MRDKLLAFFRRLPFVEAVVFTNLPGVITQKKSKVVFCVVLFNIWALLCHFQFQV